MCLALMCTLCLNLLLIIKICLAKLNGTDRYVCIDRTVKEKQSRNQICWQITKECETTDSRLRLFLENPDGCSYILHPPSIMSINSRILKVSCTFSIKR